jgi:two-component system, sensor histidine kinase and response regulator
MNARRTSEILTVYREDEAPMFGRSEAADEQSNWGHKLRLRYAIAFSVVSLLLMASAWLDWRQRDSFDKFLDTAKVFESSEGGSSEGILVIRQLTIQQLDRLAAVSNWLLILTISTILASFILIFEPMARLIERINLQREEALKVAQEASKHKSQFLANMSHEIRTPMNGIIGMAELLANTRLQSHQRDYLAMVRQSADSLLLLLNDILDFSKIEAGKLEMESASFGLRECIETTARTLASIASSKGLDLACRISDECPDVLIGDSGRLRQIVSNLLSNAIKFTAQGEVVIDVELQPIEVDSNNSQVEGLPSSDRVVLKVSVWDTGIGIPKEKQKLIFDAFSQADASTTRHFGGTGLGLAICSQLVQMMNGTIQVESEIGRGSRFWFTAEFGVAKNQLSAQRADINILKDMQVLIVDDNFTNRLVLKEICNAWKMRPLLADSASSGIHILRSCEVPVPLILTDCMMPGQDGFDFVREVRSQQSADDIKVLMLSSGVQSGDVEKCNELKIARCLSKPVAKSELLDAILDQFCEQIVPPEEPAETDLVREPRLILLVEDNMINQIVATEFLKQRGHEVVVVDDGAKAIFAIEETQYDLVLMDIQMPVMDGFEATKAIRRKENDSKSRRLPIVAMTANAMKGDREECIDAGMDGYVAKPLDRQELFAAVEAYPARARVGLIASHPGEPLDSSSRRETHESVALRTDLLKARAVDVGSIDPLINWEGVLRQYSGNRKFVEELANILYSQCPILLQAIVEASEQDDIKSLHRAAHTLKGSLYTFKIEKVAGVAQEIETAARIGELSKATLAISRLQPLIARVLEEVSSYLAALPKHRS